MPGMLKLINYIKESGIDWEIHGFWFFKQNSSD